MSIGLPFEQLKYLEGIAKELDIEGHGNQGQIIERAGAFLGFSRSTLYKHLSLVGWTSQRKLRGDRGASKISREEAFAVSNLILQSERNTGKTLMSVDDAIDIAHANGLINERSSASSMLRKMEDFGCHPKQLAHNPITQSMRSLHPNHVWQFDVSVCVLYYLKGQDGLKVMETSDFYKNKPANLDRIKNDRVLRYLVTDHYSSAFHVSYILSPGESVEAITQFLIEAFSKRSKNELMHGVPFIMIWDAGSANMAAMTKRLLDKLGVIHIAHTPGRPWAKGQVESMHNVIEKKLESRLTYKVINSVEELNEMATEWSVAFQSQFAHSRHGKTRYGLYQTIRSEQLRLAPDPEVMRSFVQTNRVERTIKALDLSITFVPGKGYGSLTYTLRHLPVMAGEKVFVSVNLYRCPAIDVEVVDENGEIQSHIVEPIVKDAAGFNINAPVYGEDYQSIAETLPQQNRKAMDLAAWGSDDPLEIKRRRKSKVRAVGFDGAVDPMADIRQKKLPSFMQRKGSELQIEKQIINEAPISEVKAWKMLSDATGLKGSAIVPYKQALKEAYPDGFTRQQLDTFIHSIGDQHACVKATTQ